MSLHAAWALQESSTADSDFDDRISVKADGSMGVIHAPVAWIPDFTARAQRAFLAFTEANRTQPKSTTQLVPYFNPPLDPATVDKMVKAESRRTP